jgi:hypothetical protein
MLIAAKLLPGLLCPLSLRSPDLIQGKLSIVPTNRQEPRASLMISNS